MLWNIIGLCIGGGLAGLILFTAYVIDLLDLMGKCDERETR